MKKCDCGNPEFGFDCVCEWVKNHPGTIDFHCEFCGIYTASEPRCNKCEKDSDSLSHSKSEEREKHEVPDYCNGFYGYDDWVTNRYL